MGSASTDSGGRKAGSVPAAGPSGSSAKVAVAATHTIAADNFGTFAAAVVASTAVADAAADTSGRHDAAVAAAIAPSQGHTDRRMPQEALKEAPPVARSRKHTVVADTGVLAGADTHPG